MRCCGKTTTKLRYEEKNVNNTHNLMLIGALSLLATYDKIKSRLDRRQTHTKIEFMVLVLKLKF